MTLRENTIFGVRDKVAESIERLRGYEQLAGPDGYLVGFSGGKDSVAILELCRMAGVKFEAHYSLTTIDPPELVRFIKGIPGVNIDLPKNNFFSLLLKHKFPPLRMQRWCCEELKEIKGTGRIIVTGIRWEESVRRSKRREFEACYKGVGTRFLNPIIDWTSAQVWEFIHARKLDYCSLYDEGWSRIGCLFCPMATPAEREMHRIRYPKYEKLFRRYFQKVYEIRCSEGTHTDWKNGDEMFVWWIGKYPGPQKIDGGLFD